MLICNIVNRQSWDGMLYAVPRKHASMPFADFDQSHAAMPGMTPARTGLFAIAAGLAVGNLYLG